MNKLRLACDIETTSRHLACLGIAWSKLDAICIPICDSKTRGTNYWSAEEEALIVAKLSELLTHPNVEIVWQNGAYDIQHIAKHWGINAHISDDTMLAQHTLFPGEPKSLDFLASIYCEHYSYWKDELTDYRQLPDDTTMFWTYNCKDCVITFELNETLNSMLHKHQLFDQYRFLMLMNQNAVRAMLRGILISQKTRNEMASQVLEAIASREQMLFDWLGFELNVGSPAQLADFFYSDLKEKKIIHRKTKQPTCDADALEKIASRNVLLRPLVSLINEMRSLGVFLSTFIQMPLDSDLRMRCSYNVGGTETFRLSSSQNAFASGGNLQNIPRNHDYEEN